MKGGIAAAIAVALLLAGTGNPTWAQTEPAPADQEQQLQEVTVTAQRLSLIGTTSTASQGIVVNDELALTPAYRPAQLLETVPGLDVTSHSGEGKANQYLLRGYNLDHGTNLAVFVDGMPVNEPTHAHGQGYADLNFMIPELATNISYTKGTYYADVGDFGSVGSIRLNYLNSLPGEVTASAGTFGFQRLFSADAQPLPGGAHLLEAVELQHYDGPWANKPDDQRKVNAVLRLSDGDAARGYSLTAMFYHGLWNAHTDQPERAVADGLITRWNTLDPSDGGQAQRSSLSGQYQWLIGAGQFSANAYVINNDLYLWNDFSHFLIDPIHGDQEQQHENRATVGADASYAWSVQFAGARQELVSGLHTRDDYNTVSRLPSEDRVLLTQTQLAAVDYPTNFSEQDQIRLHSFAAYVQDTTHWTDWFRTVLGVREDLMQGSDTGSNAGSASAALFQPKASLIFRPRRNTELYLSYGRGFHSDDLRGVNQAASSGMDGAPLIASQTGEEIGVRQQFGARVAATLALYNLKAQSETTYNPDVGQDSAGPGSIRRGLEVNLTYQALRWLEFYGSYSPNRARYTSDYDDGTGHVGRYLPNAPFATGSFQMYIKARGPWDASLEYRYLSAYPLSSDDEVQGHGYGEWNGDVYYSFPGHWKLGLGVYNILNRKGDAMEYWYTDRLRGEPLDGVADVHFHPLEPISERLTISRTF